MTVEAIPIGDRADWLARRKFDVTASTVGALFGLHPYVSALRLYVDKQGLVDLPPFKDSGPMRRGRWYEHGIPEAIKDTQPEWADLTIAKNKHYFRDNEIALAATPDFFVHDDPRGIGNLQAKTAAPDVFQRDWMTDGKLTPPMWIVLQAITEMMLADCSWGAVACLIADPYNPDLKLAPIERHAATEQKIRDAVVKFWDDVENGREPGPDYGLDRDVLKALLPSEIPAKLIDLRFDNEAIAGLQERAALREQISAAEDRCKVIETMVMAKLGDAETALVPGFSVNWKTGFRKGYTVADKTSRVLRIKEKSIA